MNTYAVTHWRALLDPHGVRRAHSYATLLRLFSTPANAAEKSALPGVSLATFRANPKCPSCPGSHRLKSGVERVCGIGIDIDGGATFAEAVEPFAHVAGFIHSTPSSRPEAERWRIVLLLAAPILADDAEDAARAMIARARGSVDAACKDPSRLWFRPWASAAHNVFAQLGGAPLDGLVTAADWRARTAPATPSGPLAPVRAPTRYAQKAIDNLLAELHEAPKGHRHEALTRAAFHLGRLIGGGVLPASAIEAVAAATSQWPNQRDVVRTIKGQVAIGQTKPYEKR